jgi:hypothetical protein
MPQSRRAAQRIKLNCGLRRRSPSKTCVPARLIELMEVRNPIVSNGDRQKENVLVQFIKSTLQDALFLNKSMREKQLVGVKATYVTSELLDQGLLDRLLAIAQLKVTFHAFQFRGWDFLLKTAESLSKDGKRSAREIAHDPKPKKPR